MEMQVGGLFRALSMVLGVEQEMEMVSIILVGGLPITSYKV